MGLSCWKIGTLVPLLIHANIQPSNHVADAVHVKSVSYYLYQTAEQRKNVITVIWVPDGPLEYFSLESLRKLLQKKKSIQQAEMLC